jgi:hypothetical protein
VKDSDKAAKVKELKELGLKVEINGGRFWFGGNMRYCPPELRGPTADRCLARSYVTPEAAWDTLLEQLYA